MKLELPTGSRCRVRVNVSPGHRLPSCVLLCERPFNCMSERASAHERETEADSCKDDPCVQGRHLSSYVLSCGRTVNEMID